MGVVVFYHLEQSKCLFVNDAVAKLGKLSAVPSSGSTYEVAGDTLQLINLVALAVRTLFEVLVSILKSAVQATVTVVVY